MSKRNSPQNRQQALSRLEKQHDKVVEQLSQLEDSLREALELLSPPKPAPEQAVSSAA